MPNQRHRVTRRIGLAFGVYALAVLLVIGALYLEENWRGAHAWAAFQRELQAKGESLDWKTFTPPPVPDAQNLAMAPLFVRAFSYRPSTKTGTYTFGPASEMPADLKDLPYGPHDHQEPLSVDWRIAKHTDLPRWQRYYRQHADFPHADSSQLPAADVLLALSRYAPILDELAQAATERPLTRFPADWYREDTFAITLPHYRLEQQLIDSLRLRASAQLAAGRSDAALRDLELCLRLCRDMRAEPNLIALLVQVTCLNKVAISVWEGLADRRWSAAELVRLQADLQKFDIVANHVFTMRGERAFVLHGLDYYWNLRPVAFFQGMGSIQESSPSSVNPGTRLLGSLFPKGWYDLNRTLIARYEQDYAVEAADPKQHRFFPDKPAAGERALTAMRASPTNFFAKIILPVLVNLTSRFALTQTGIDEAVTACALERFYLDHHAYPARLDELVPTYLERVPNDVIDGAALRYQQTPDGRYQLRSVGWNGHDDDGRVVWRSATKLKDDEGDWVWQYEALEPPPPNATK